MLLLAVTGKPFCLILHLENIKIKTKSYFQPTFFPVIFHSLVSTKIQPKWFIPATSKSLLLLFFELHHPIQMLHRCHHPCQPGHPVLFTSTLETLFPQIFTFPCCARLHVPQWLLHIRPHCWLLPKNMVLIILYFFIVWILSSFLPLFFVVQLKLPSFLHYCLLPYPLPHPTFSPPLIHQLSLSLGPLYMVLDHPFFLYVLPTFLLSFVSKILQLSTYLKNVLV